ncbi:hypothetical protein D3C73_761020 [compost metagenome]
MVQGAVQCLKFPLTVVQQIEHLPIGVSRTQTASDELTGLRIGKVRVEVSHPGDQCAVREADPTTAGQVTEAAIGQTQRRPGTIQRALLEDQRHLVAMSTGIIRQFVLQSLDLIAIQFRPCRFGQVLQ